MSKPLRVLILEDQADDAELIVFQLHRAGFDVEWTRVDTKGDFLAHLDPQLDLILADYHLPHFNALEALQLLQSRGLDIPFIVVTGAVGEEAAVECMKFGAYDYLLKDRLTRLGPAVQSALEKKRLRSDKQRAEEELRELERIVNCSPAVVFLWQAAEGWPVKFVSENVQQFGYTPEMFYNGRLSYASIVHPEDLERVAAEVARYSAEEGREGFEQEYRILTSDGEVRWLHDYTRIRRDEDGHITHYQGIVLDVTEQKRAEEALRESSDRFRSLVEHSHAGILIVDESYRFVYVNDELSRILGYPPEEIVGEDFRKFLDEESRELVADRYVRRQRGEEVPSCYEFNVVRKDGQKRRVEIRVSVITDPQGNVRTIGQLLDITDRKRAEEALHHYIERLTTLREIDRAILEAQSPEEIAEAALIRLRRLIPCQQACVMLFDPPTSELEVLAVHMNGETQLGTGKRIPFEASRLAGTYIAGDLETLPSPGPLEEMLLAEGIRDFLSVPLIAQGHPVGLLSVGAARSHSFSSEHAEIAQEVADQLAVAIQNARLLERERRRGAELEALRQASLHLTSSLEPKPVLEAVLEHALRLVVADDAHIFLYDGDQLTFGAALWAGELQQEPFAEPRPEGLTYTVARTGERMVVSNVDEHPLFQSWKWGGAILGLPLRVRDQVVGVMNIAFNRPHNFTEDELRLLELLADQAAIAIQNARLHQQVRRHAEELAVALARLQELDRMKSEFIQNVSHELRSPLALIRGYAELLDKGELGELEPQQHGPIGIITRRAQMLSELVEDITLILGAEARSLEREPVALDRLAQTAVEDFRVVASEAGLTLETEFAPDLPPVGGESIYLRRVLDNLLGNAVKFTPSGGRITVRLWQEGGNVILQVADTGIGIPPEHRDRIFERFYQVDGSTRRRYGGMGLGLALVKEVVEKLGGSVGVESEVGKGTTFTVILPVFPEPAG